MLNKEHTDFIIVRNVGVCVQVLAAISVSLGSMIAGFVSAYTSPAIPSMVEYPDGLGNNITDVQVSNLYNTPVSLSITLFTKHDDIDNV